MVASGSSFYMDDTNGPQIDVEDLKAFPKKVAEVTRRFSDIDQIILMAGSGSVFDFKDISSSSDTHIASEIATNVTFPMIASRLIVPFLISRDQPAQIVLVSSGLAFVPFPIYPVYCPAKAAVHYFACTLRGQLADTPITVTELIPPYVDTDFDKNFRAQLMERTGGKLKAMPLDEFTEEAYKGLQDRSDGKPKKEVGVGTAATRAGIWWDAFRPVFEQYGVSTMNS
ncbi:NAD(P)-binding protein [Viridothelium virens]|uniref:NAD(P)-binding protein n=1 Tax=Viridothelium virens TaxID=1048519 RepID=A0A6A6HPZ3_VIRVR|nr:NAD(P)-binding protein [Viridothelium virens]